MSNNPIVCWYITVGYKDGSSHILEVSEGYPPTVTERIDKYLEENYEVNWED